MLARFMRSGVKASDLSGLPITLACFRKVASRVASMRPRVLLADGTPAAQQPEWLRRPSPIWSWSDIVCQAIYSLVFEGDLFLLPRLGVGGRVSQFVVVPPRLVGVERIGRSNDPFQSYRLLLNGRPNTSMVHIRYLALPGEMRGAGIRDSMAVSTKISQMSEAAILRHFTQAAKPGVLFSTKQPLAPDVLEEANKIVGRRFSGVEEWWKPQVLPGGATVIPPLMNAESAQYLALSQWADARIASQLFDIDPTLLGINLPGSQLTYNNAQDRTGNLWRDAIRWPASKIEEATSYLTSAGRRVDLDDSSILLGGPEERLEYASMMTSMQVGGEPVFTVDEIRAAAGFLPLEE